MGLRKWLKGAALGTAIALAPGTTMAKGNEPHVPKGLDMRTKSSIIQTLPKKPKKIIRPRLDKALRLNSNLGEVPNAFPKTKLERIVLPPIKKVEYTIPWWQHVIQIPIAYGATVLVHEGGHAAMMKAYGYKGIKLNGADPSNSIVMSVSSAGYPYLGYRPSKIEKDVISGAGVGFTSLTNIALTSLLRADVVPEKLKSFVATTSLMMMFDRYRYVLSSSLKFAFRKKISGSDDIYGIISNHYKSRRGQAIAYGVLAGVTALEIGLRHKEIKYLIYTALGRKEYYKPNVIYVRATPTSFGPGAIFNVSGSFDENKLFR